MRLWQRTPARILDSKNENVAEISLIKLENYRNCLITLVGARGFEPPTPCAQGRCATRLRYAPTPVKRMLSIVAESSLLTHVECRHAERVAGNPLSGVRASMERASLFHHLFLKKRAILLFRFRNTILPSSTEVSWIQFYPLLRKTKTAGGTRKWALATGLNRFPPVLALAAGLFQIRKTVWKPQSCPKRISSGETHEHRRNPPPWEKKPR
jgi:hypothetical protein